MATRRFYSRLSQLKSKKSIDIQKVGKEKFFEAVGFMRKNFLDNPFIRSMGISVRHKETHNFLSALWLTLLRSELSLAAIHRNRICGLCINFPHTPGGGPPNDILLRLAKLVKTEATRNLLQSWDKISREAPLPTGEIVDGRQTQIMELAGLAVAYRYRQLGIGQKLVQSSAHSAMLLGFEYVRVDCTHMATAKICERLGWKKIWEMPFEKFDGVLTNTHDSLTEKENHTVKVYLQRVQS